MDHSLCAQWPRLRCHCRITTRHHGLEQLERSRSAALANDVSTTTGIRAAASGRPLVAFLSSLRGLVRNISRSPALKCWAIFKHQPDTQAKRPRAWPSFLCRTRGNKHTGWRDRVVLRGASQARECLEVAQHFRSRSPTRSCSKPHEIRARAAKKARSRVESCVCDAFRETRGNWRRPSGLSVALDVSRAEEQLTTARDISFRNEVVELDQFLFPALQLW